MNEKYPLSLPENTVLAGQYIIQEPLGQGGFGITYKAVDRLSGKYVAVKEYFPETMATRMAGKTDVITYSGDRGENFIYGKQCFMQEAETLAQFIGNENIVRVYSYFEEYGTAYFVMDYIEGTPLDEYVKLHGGKISFEEASDILIPIMDALGAVHDKGIVHRDVSPDNIYITKKGEVKLIDFGAARQSLGDKSQSLDVILKHGFAPKEQYMRRGKQGAFTDIYALGATFYYVLTGKRPPDALERVDEDDIIPPSTLGVKLSREAEEAILMALNVQPEDRFQSMSAFKNAMLAVRVQGNDRSVYPTSAMNSTIPVKQVNPANSSAEHDGPRRNKGKGKKRIIIGAGIAAAMVAVVFFGMAYIGSVGSGGRYSGAIIGNNVNNLSNGSGIIPGGDMEGEAYLDMDNDGKRFRSLSIIDDKVYAVNGAGIAVRFNMTDNRNISGAEVVPQLSDFQNITQLYVSKNNFYVFTSDRKLYCVSRTENKTQESYFDYDNGEFTFTEKGRLCYIVREYNAQSDGYYWNLYVTPIGEIDQIANADYYTFPDDFSGVVSDAQLFGGVGDEVYIYLYCLEKNLNRLYKFDLSKNTGENPAIYDYNDAYRRQGFNYDGKNVISAYWEGYSGSNFRVESLEFDTGKTELFYNDNVDTAGNQINYFDELTVYPGKTDKVSLLVGPVDVYTGANRALQLDLPLN